MILDGLSVLFGKRWADKRLKDKGGSPPPPAVGREGGASGTWLSGKITVQDGGASFVVGTSVWSITEADSVGLRAVKTKEMWSLDPDFVVLTIGEREIAMDKAIASEVLLKLGKKDLLPNLDS